MVDRDAHRGDADAGWAAATSRNPLQKNGIHDCEVNG